MLPGKEVIKDPDAEKFYEWDWSAWLGAAAIASHAIAVEGLDAELAFDNNTVVDGTAVRVRLKAGTRGRDYTVTCRITTNEAPSQTDDRSIIVKVRSQ